MNLQKLQNMWDTFSTTYTAQQKNPSGFCFTLINMLQIENSDLQKQIPIRILDAGCGGGHLHQYIVEKKKPTAKLVAFDFSNQMVKITAARMVKYLTSNVKGGLDNLQKEEVENVNINSEHFKQINYELSQANIMDLPQFQDNTFDTYFSNLVFHLIPEPEKAMAEAFRILKPGGRIGFSVWGSKANSRALTIYQEALIKSGLLQVPPGPSKFLESTDSIIALAQKYGFTNIYCWTQINPFDNYSYQDLTRFTNPEVHQLLKDGTPEQIKKFEEIVSEIIQTEKEKFKPLTLECILLIATKPE